MISAFHHWLVVFFAWPAGSIWSNILAWALCGALAFGWTHRVIKRHHAEHMAAAAENRRRLDHLIEHTAEVPPLPER